MKPIPIRLEETIATNNTAMNHSQLGDIMTLANDFDGAITHYSFALRCVGLFTHGACL